MSWLNGPPQFPGAPAAVEHVCPLTPITEAEATLALLEVSRTAQNTEQIVARLGKRGLAIGRRP